MPEYSSIYLNSANSFTLYIFFILTMFGYIYGFSGSASFLHIYPMKYLDEN